MDSLARSRSIGLPPTVRDHGYHLGSPHNIVSRCCEARGEHTIRGTPRGMPWTHVTWLPHAHAHRRSAITRCSARGMPEHGKLAAVPSYRAVEADQQGRPRESSEGNENTERSKSTESSKSSKSSEIRESSDTGETGGTDRDQPPSPRREAIGRGAACRLASRAAAWVVRGREGRAAECRLMARKLRQR